MKVDALQFLVEAGVEPHLASTPLPASKSFWSELIARLAQEAGINPALAVRVARYESGLNPQAVNPSSGATGLMQLMPGTAADLGVDAHNVVENIRGGIEYLRQQFERFGNAAQALAAYNWGPAHVTSALAQWGSDWFHHIPQETQHYVASILSEPLGDAPSGSRNMAALPSPASNVPLRGQAAIALERIHLEQALEAYLLTAILG
ncbi:MAG TPA: lytic transglycosylase domain-containing protein [Terriglobia bacterium]|nr:lytic transglycosylase domain-containing protein [Terriglobia bacterium]